MIAFKSLLKLVEQILRRFSPQAPKGITYKFLGRFDTVLKGIMMASAVVKLDWAVSVSPNVSSQVLVISLGGVDGEPITLDAVTDTYTVNIPASTDVSVSLVAVNAFGSSNAATLAFSVPDLSVPAEPVFANPGWSILSVIPDPPVN